MVDRKVAAIAVVLLLIAALFILVSPRGISQPETASNCPTGQYATSEDAAGNVVCAKDFNPNQILPCFAECVNLVGNWPLDEGTGTIAYDLSGNGNTGTLVNSPTWQSGANCKFGNCLNFVNKNQQYVSFPSVNSLISNSITYTIWFETSNFVNEPSNTGTIDNWGGGNSNGASFIICCSGSASISFRTYTGGGHEIDSAPVTLSNNQWHFLAGTISGTNAVFYIDGGIVNSFSTFASFSLNSNLYIGDYINGNLDDFKIYNVALTPTQINQLYTYGLEYHN